MKLSGRLSLTITGLVFCFFLVFEARAQQGADGKRSLLPDIDPQDIEIRSEFKANFKGLNRQPILGFRPEAKIFEVGEDRQPFIESQDERMADLPVIQLSRPDPPSMDFFSYPPQGALFAETGFGSFVSPEAHWFAGIDMSERSSLTARLNHHSSSGHLMGDYGAFRNLDGLIKYDWDIKNAGRLQLDVGAESNFNNLYSPNLNMTVDTRNEFSGGHVKAQYEVRQNDYQGWSISAAYNLFEARTQISPEFVSSVSGKNREHVAKTQFQYQWTGNRLHEIYRLDVRGQLGRYNAQQPSPSDWFKSHAGFTYQRLLGHRTFVSGMMGIQFAGEPGGGRLLYPAASLEAKRWFGQNLSMEAQLEARLRHESFKLRYNENPFLLAIRPQFAHSYRIGGDLQVDYHIFKRTLLELKSSYYNIEDYAFYANRNRVARSVRGNSVVNILSPYYKTFYEDARIGTVRFTMTHDLMPNIFWMEASGFYRTHELTESSSSAIPFKANYGIQTTFFVKPIPSFRIELWGQYSGPRRNSDDTADLQSYFLAGSKFEYQINDHLGAYIKGRNLLDQQYQIWEGYVARPLQLYGGIIFSL